MEDLTPTLILLWDVKRSLQKGRSVRFGAEMFLNRNICHDFATNFRRYYRSDNLHAAAADAKTFNYLQRQLLELIQLGASGESILNHITQLEKEVISSCEQEINQYLALLPLKSLVPLMLCLLPAMMLLLLPPLLKMLHF